MATKANTTRIDGQTVQLDIKGLKGHNAAMEAYIPLNGDKPHYTVRVQVERGSISIFGYLQAHQGLYTVNMCREIPKEDRTEQSGKYEHVWIHINDDKTIIGHTGHEKPIKGTIRDALRLNKTDGDNFDAARTIWESMRAEE